MERNTLVSICIPAFNAEKYIEETVHSLLAQTHKNLELIIVDDGSSDATIDKIKAFTDSRIQLFHNIGKGAASARNYAYSKSTGEFIVFFDADDLVEENFIETQLNALNHPNAVVVSKWGRFQGFDRNSFVLSSTDITTDLTFKEWITHYWKSNTHTTPPGRVFMPRNLLEKSELWDESLTLHDDMEFFTRVFSKSSIIAFNSDSLFYYRSGINGLSSSLSRQAQISAVYSLFKSINTAIAIFPDDKDVKEGCANLLQGFVYAIYPDYKDLCKRCESSIKDLGGSTLKYVINSKSQLYFLKLFGWKPLEAIKVYVNRKLR